MREFTPRRAVEIPTSVTRKAIAVLTSSGLQSAILTSYLLEEFETVYPVFVRTGKAGELAEEQQLRRFLAAVRGPKLGRLTILAAPGETGNDTLLPVIERAAQWCAENGIESIAHGALEAKPVTTVTTSCGKAIAVVAPFANISRASVLELGRHLPLDFTFSCNRPVVRGLVAKHCGQCLKCQTRKLGLAGIRVNDRTAYAGEEKVALSAS